MQKIKFKRTIEPNHNQYYLSIHNQIGFLDGLNDRVLSFIEDKALYSLGVWDFNLNDESLFYSLVVSFFAKDKELFLVTPSIEEIDATAKLIDIAWTPNVKFSRDLGELNLSTFEYANSYKLASLSYDSMFLFSRINHFLTTFTFMVGVKEEALIELLQDKTHQPNIEELLDVAEYVMTLKIVGDDEGYFHHIVIQSKDALDKKIKKLEVNMEGFRGEYTALLDALKDSEDLERNTKIYLHEVQKLRENFLNLTSKKDEPVKEEKKSNLNEEKLKAIDWSKLSTAEGLESASFVPEVLRELSVSDRDSFDRLYNTLTRQGDVFTATYYAIPFLIEIIEKGYLLAMQEAYDLLFESVIGYSMYDEKVIYKGKNLALKEAIYNLVLENMERYLQDLEVVKDETLATYILDLIGLFLDTDSVDIKRLKAIAKTSVIKEKINQEIFEWENSDKIEIMCKVINGQKDENFKDILEKGLLYLTENTGCAEDLKVTEYVLDNWFDKKIIDSDVYWKCVENSACGRWF